MAGENPRAAVQRQLMRSVTMRPMSFRKTPPNMPREAPGPLEAFVSGHVLLSGSKHQLVLVVSPFHTYESNLQNGLKVPYSPAGEIIENRSYMLDVKWDVVLTLGNQYDRLPQRYERLLAC